MYQLSAVYACVCIKPVMAGWLRECIAPNPRESPSSGYQFIYEVAVIGNSGPSPVVICPLAQMDKAPVDCIYKGPANSNGHKLDEGEYYGCYIGTHVCGKILITRKG